mgnify:CR=1 FL=1
MSNKLSSIDSSEVQSSIKEKLLYGKVASDIKDYVELPAQRSLKSQEEIKKSISKTVFKQCYMSKPDVLRQSINDYIQVRYLTPEQFEQLQIAKNQEEVENLLNSFGYYNKIEQETNERLKQARVSITNLDTGITYKLTPEQIGQLPNAQGEQFCKLLESFMK